MLGDRNDRASIACTVWQDRLFVLHHLWSHCLWSLYNQVALFLSWDVWQSRLASEVFWRVPGVEIFKIWLPGFHFLSWTDLSTPSTEVLGASSIHTWLSFFRGRRLGQAIFPSQLGCPVPYETECFMHKLGSLTIFGPSASYNLNDAAHVHSLVIPCKGNFIITQQTHILS